MAEENQVPETPIPTAEDLVAAYAEAEALPDFLPPEEIERVRINRRRAALTAVRQIRDSGEEVGLAMHRAYRPEVVAETAVPLGEDSDWEQIAQWCGGTIGSAPDGTDSGEWTSWIALPNGESAFSGMWIIKALDGTFSTRYAVAEPDETSLLQAEAIGWQKGASTALSLAGYDDNAGLALPVPNPGAAYLPTDTSTEETAPSLSTPGQD